MKSYLTLIRPHQWIKNLFLLIPAFFAEVFFVQNNIINLLLGFFAFSISASSIYILNDYLDREKDKLHPTKKNRPIAAGKVAPSMAFILMFILFLSGVAIGYIIDERFFIVICSYLIINIFYSTKLKHIAILDINIIAIGFLLRVFAGAFAVDVAISKWLILITYLLAVFMGLAKRRDDVLIFNENGQSVRSVVKGYNLEFINSAMVIMGAVTIVSYIMYTVSPEVIERIGNDYVYLTTFFVIIGVFRYLQLTLVHNETGSPTKILYRDRFIQASLIGWIVTFIILIYVI
ncbi:MAG: decaprenyl-phosphate phosphoribosyltransferase [Cytophagaceae bacterium]